MSAKDNNNSKAIAPPFEINLFHQPITRRSREILKEDYSTTPEKGDLAVKIKGSGAQSITVNELGGLEIRGNLVEFNPWDTVQIAITVDWASRSFAVIKVGESSLRIKEPIRNSSFFVRGGKAGEKKTTEIPGHIFDLINDEEGRSVYLSGITFVPDPKMEESYVPHANSGIAITEVVNSYVLRIWNIRLETSGGVTRLSKSFKEVARPNGLTGKEGDEEVMRKYIEENGHLFF